MQTFLHWFKSLGSDNIVIATRREFENVRPVLESLKAYDEGKKEISTSDIRERFHRVQSTTR